MKTAHVKGHMPDWFDKSLHEEKTAAMRDGMTPDLFTKRIRKPPAVPEIALHRMVAETFSRWKKPGWVAFHPANGEKRDKATAIKLKDMLVLPGVSDLILFGPPNASVHAMEFKSKGEKPSDAQKAFMKDVILAGGHAVCVDSYDAALIQLKLWGAVSDRVKVSV